MGMIPEMIFKIDLNSRIGLREMINDDGRQLQRQTTLQKKKRLVVESVQYLCLSVLLEANLVEDRENDTRSPMLKLLEGVFKQFTKKQNVRQFLPEHWDGEIVAQSRLVVGG